MSGEPSSITSTGETLHGQASQTLHGHVNSIKSKLGLDNENSPLGKLAAHTKRKMAELEAARAAGVTAPPGSPDWQAAMKPESFGKGFVKANRTQFLITASVFSLGLFWMIVIRTVHHNDNVSQTGNSEMAQRAIANQQMAGGAPPQQMLQSAPMPGGATGFPTGFGSPNSGFGAPNPSSAYQQAATGLSGFAPTGVPMNTSNPYAQQVQLPAASPQVYSPYAQQSAGFPVRIPASNFSSQQAPTLYPMRQHTAARHQVVVNR